MLDVDYNGSDWATATFTSPLRGSTYGGALSGADIIGNYNGQFFGPNAEETGGAFNINKNDSTNASGVFFAR